MAVDKKDVYIFLALLGLLFWMLLAVTVVVFHHANGLEIPFLKLIATLPPTVLAVMFLGYFYAFMKGVFG